MENTEKGFLCVCVCVCVRGDYGVIYFPICSTSHTSSHIRADTNAKGEFISAIKIREVNNGYMNLCHNVLLSY